MNNEDMAVELIHQLENVLKLIDVHIPAIVICSHGGQNERDSQVIITEKEYPFLREALSEAMDRSGMYQQVKPTPASGMYQQVKPTPAPVPAEKRCHVRTFRGSI